MIPNFKENKIHFIIGQAHGQHSSKINKSKCDQAVAITKLETWSFSKKAKSYLISASQEGQTEIIFSQMYPKSVNDRRSKTLELRMKLEKNDPSLLEYVKYSPILKMKKTIENKYIVQKDFYFRFLSYQVLINFS